MEEQAKSEETYIERVRLQGYKSIEDVEITFKPGMNILIGANGSGKTNFVKFLDVILKREYDDVTEIQFNATIYYSASGNSSRYEVEYLKLDPSQTKLNFRERFFDGERAVTDEKEAIQWYYKWINLMYPRFLAYGVPEAFENINRIERIESIEESTRPPTPFFLASKPKLSDGLMGLFKDIFIHYKQREVANDDSLSIIPAEFAENLRLHTPVENIRLAPNYRFENTKNGKEILHVRFEFLVDGKWQPWTHLSDGTKRLVYIITEVTFANNIILLEEPELGIHPHQLSKLMDFLEAAAEHKQIILTTHSPQVLNILRPDELDRIIVVHYDKDSGTKMSHLTEEEQEHARNYMETEGLFLSDYWVHSGFEKETESV